MERNLYSSNEIKVIKKNIELFKNFYLKSNKKPFYYLTTSIIAYISSIMLLRKINISYPFLVFVPLDFSLFFTIVVIILFSKLLKSSIIVVLEDTIKLLVRY